MYTTLLLFLTQQLSLRRNLIRKQPLTTVHDIGYAWNGLGFALHSLWLQFTASSTTIGVLAVFGYLSCITVLHIVTSSLFNVEPFNQPFNANISTVLATPNASALDL